MRYISGMFRVYRYGYYIFNNITTLRINESEHIFSHSHSYINFIDKSLCPNIRSTSSNESPKCITILTGSGYSS